MHSEASIEWTALRERPSPVLMSASPAMVKGGGRIREGVGAFSVMGMGMRTRSLFVAAGEKVRADGQRQAEEFHAHTSKDKNRSRVRGQEKNNGGRNNGPSGEQQ